MAHEEARPALSRALAAIEALYTSNVREHGVDSRSVGWPDPELQVLRFEKLAYLIDADGYTGSVTVNDFGCGYGAMFGFLAARLGPRLAEYRGYDISGEMLTAARQHVDDPRATFFNRAHLDRDADYTFVSGTFNVRSQASDDDWGAFVKDTLRALAARSRRGFAFNLLSSYVDWRKEDLFYADPAEYFSYCRAVCRFVTLLHDYPLYEWTIVAIHERG